RQRPAQRLFHLGIVGCTARLAVYFQGDVVQTGRAALQMRELLEPEAYRPEPLLLRATAGCNLDPVLDLEVRKVRLHHAENSAAIFFRGYWPAQPKARSYARRRPYIAQWENFVGLGDLHRVRYGRSDEPSLRRAEARLGAEACAHADPSGNGSQHNDAQQPRSGLAFQHGTLAVLGAPPLGSVASSMQTLDPQFAAALRLKRVTLRPSRWAEPVWPRRPGAYKDWPRFSW